MTEPLPQAVTADSLPPRIGSRYPAHFAGPSRLREKRPLGELFGLANFGANQVRLPPGSWSSQRHWHTRQDELIYVLQGELVLVTDQGEQTLSAGMVVGFAAGSGNGHHLINRSAADALYLEIGDRAPGDVVHYSEIDLSARAQPPRYHYHRRDGEPYPD